jgi:hypothetical protein
MTTGSLATTPSQPKVAMLSSRAPEFAPEICPSEKNPDALAVFTFRNNPVGLIRDREHSACEAMSSARLGGALESEADRHVDHARLLAA